MTDEADSREPRLPRLKPEEVAPAEREVFDAFHRERGKIPNLFRVAAARGEIMRTLATHMRAVMGAGEVPVLLKELLSVRVSHLNACEY